MMTSVKSEGSIEKHELCMVESTDLNIAPETNNKCVKRRRRSFSALSLGSCNDQNGHDQQQQQEVKPLLQVDQSTTATTVKRSSRFRGVSRHRWTGRYEAHLWDKGSWNVTQRKKGKQVYLGAYDEEESAARAYDLAAIKHWGPTTFTNVPISDYEKEIEIMQNVTREEYLATLRRRSSGFSRGVSKYRGVARHHHNGRWEARIGRVFGNKYLYLGTYSTQEEAAHAYDIAAIEYRGTNAVTNFDLSTYIRSLRQGANSPSSHDPTQTTEFHSIHTSPNTIPRVESEFSILPHSYPMRESAFPRKQEVVEVVERKMPLSPSSTKSSSSPTALGLLLRSSMFRELVERNSNATEEETGGNDANENLQFRGEGTFGGVFCSGIGNIMPSLASQANKVSTLYSQTGHSVKNSSRSLGSSTH